MSRVGHYISLLDSKSLPIGAPWSLFCTSGSELKNGINKHFTWIYECVFSATEDSLRLIFRGLIDQLAGLAGNPINHPHLLTNFDQFSLQEGAWRTLSEDFSRRFLGFIPPRRRTLQISKKYWNKFQYFKSGQFTVYCYLNISFYTYKYLITIWRESFV